MTTVRDLGATQPPMPDGHYWVQFGWPNSRLEWETALKAGPNWWRIGFDDVVGDPAVVGPKIEAPE